jgi:hypothetical protein
MDGEEVFVIFVLAAVGLTLLIGLAKMWLKNPKPPGEPTPQFTTELEALISIERQLKLLNFRMIGLTSFLFMLFLLGWRIFTL